MERFHFNPMSLTKGIREFFPNLQTLYLYFLDDELFEDDERIIAREIQFIPYNYISGKEKEQLEQWTNKRCGEVVFDSDKDDWNQNTSVFDSRVSNKSNLVFIVEDTINNKYGYYFNGTINQYESFIKANGSFLFSLKSNGRVNGMHKFEEKDKSRGFYLYKKSDTCLFYIHSGIYIHKENNKNRSWVYEDSNVHEYHGITKALHPDLRDGSSVEFIPKRFVVIQMN
jgi:hypothetical protein